MNFLPFLVVNLQSQRHKTIIHMLSIVTPKVCKVHCVPFVLLQNVANEFTRLEKRVNFTTS